MQRRQRIYKSVKHNSLRYHILQCTVSGSKLNDIKLIEGSRILCNGGTAACIESDRCCCHSSSHVALHTDLRILTSCLRHPQGKYHLKTPLGLNPIDHASTARWKQISLINS